MSIHDVLRDAAQRDLERLMEKQQHADERAREAERERSDRYKATLALLGGRERATSVETRLPPSNTRAEQALLGALIVDNRGGRLRRDSVSPWISGASAG